MLEKFIRELMTNTETKAFWKTSEFWVFVGVQVTTLGNLVPTGNATVRTIIAGAAAAAYALSRGLAKAGVKPGVNPGP